MTDKILSLIVNVICWLGVVGLTLVFAVLLASGLTGCATGDGYQRYLSAQSAAIKSQKPMLRIVAQPGQAITGLASIEVYGPGVAIQQERENEWARVVSSGINVLGVVGGIVAAGQASQDLVTAVGGLGISSMTTDNSVIDNRTVDSHAADSHAITNSYNPINNTATPTVVNPVVVQPQVVTP